MANTACRGLTSEISGKQGTGGGSWRGLDRCATCWPVGITPFLDYPGGSENWKENRYILSWSGWSIRGETFQSSLSVWMISSFMFLKGLEFLRTQSINWRIIRGHIRVRACPNNISSLHKVTVSNRGRGTLTKHNGTTFNKIKYFFNTIHDFSSELRAFATTSLSTTNSWSRYQT